MPADYDKLFRPTDATEPAEDDVGQSSFDPNASNPPKGNGVASAAPPIDWSQPIRSAPVSSPVAPPSRLPPMPIAAPPPELPPALPEPPQFSDLAPPDLAPPAPPP